VNGRYLNSANSSDERSDNKYSFSNHSYSTLNLFVLNNAANLDKTNITFTNMDILTVVWYFSTFLVLVAFFAVMACSDSHCGRSRKPEVPALTPPPTPAPSYREFAPPSYDSVANGYDSVANGIFIIALNEKTNIGTPSDIISAQPPSSDLSDVFVQRV